MTFMGKQFWMRKIDFKKLQRIKEQRKKEINREKRKGIDLEEKKRKLR
jgi:hypothetical protein